MSAWNYYDELKALYRLRASLTYAEFTYCVALLIHADGEGDTYVTPKRIAEDTGFTLRRIKGVAARLKRQGIVKIVEHGRRGHQGVLRFGATGFTQSGAIR